jgi:hypothetical protein
MDTRARDFPPQSARNETIAAALLLKEGVM